MNQGMITVFYEYRVWWTSPELLDWNYRPTKESDVYALGMVIYEVRIFIIHVTATMGSRSGTEAGFM